MAEEEGSRLDRGSTAVRPRAVALRSLVDELDGPRPALVVPADTVVTGIALDSRQVGPGSLFVAVRGTQTDGHRFVEEALSRGARALVLDRPEVAAGVASRAWQAGCAVVLVSDSRRTLPRLAASFYGHPGQHLTVAGITGTVGKTSTAYMLHRLLQFDGGDAGVIGSLGVRFGEQARPSSLTTPDAVTLQRTLAEMLEAGVRRVVMEVSSHALLQHRVDAIPFRLGLLTNILPHEHSDFHPTFRHYVEAKRSFLERLDPEAVLVYNASDPVAAWVSGFWPAERRLGFRMEGNGAAARRKPSPDAPVVEARVTGIDRNGTGLWLSLPDRLPKIPGASHHQGTRPQRNRSASYGVESDGLGAHQSSGIQGLAHGPREVWSLRLRLLGSHAATNALAAATAALVLGLDPGTLWEALESLGPMRRRMEVVFRGAFTVLDDTTGHPESYEHLLATVERMDVPGVVLVVAVRGSRGARVNALNGRTIARWSRRLPIRAVFTTDSCDAVNRLNAVMPEERDALLAGLAEGAVAPQHHESLGDALSEALRCARPGDLVVLAGAQGMDAGADMIRRLIAQEGFESDPQP